MSHIFNDDVRDAYHAVLADRQSRSACRLTCYVLTPQASPKMLEMAHVTVTSIRSKRATAASMRREVARAVGIEISRG
jgi:hypothetical protein